MKVQAKTLLNFEDVVKTLQKVYNCQEFTPTSAYRMKRMCDGITTEMKRINELLSDIHKVEDEEKKKAKLDDLIKMEVEVKFGPMTKEEFNCLTGLSPMDMTMLESFTEPSAFAELES